MVGFGEQHIYAISLIRVLGSWDFDLGSSTTAGMAIRWLFSLLLSDLASERVSQMGDGSKYEICMIMGEVDGATEGIANNIKNKIINLKKWSTPHQSIIL